MTTATYPAARDFRGGLTCAHCSRGIPDGAPYATRPEGVTADGTPVTLIVCVYCEEAT